MIHTNLINTRKTGRVIGVSLGPGEPELITLKALKVLQQSDAIYCPGTRTKEGITKSRSREILERLPIENRFVHCFTISMSKDRTGVNRVYDEVCEEIVQRVQAGETVSITAEGDVGFYSSGNYLFEKLQQAGVPISMIAGIPAFIAAGALAGLHIVKQEEKLIVFPGKVSSCELQQFFGEGYVMVIMKLSQCAKDVHDFVSQCPNGKYHYYENIGTPDEYYTTRREEMLTKDFPYFSLMIIQKYAIGTDIA